MNTNSRSKKGFNSTHANGGFSLIEMLIALVLGLSIMLAIVEIMVSNSVTLKLNRALASTQENSRFIISRMRNELLMVGLYDKSSINVNHNVDIAKESIFVRSHPIPLPGDFVKRSALGALQGKKSASDTLVISLQAKRDCRGYKLGYTNTESFYVVNQYFVDGTKFKCRGFDGRYLRGQKAAVGHNRHAAFTLLDGVLSFQVNYGVAHTSKNDGAAIPIRYLAANELNKAFAAGMQVVSIRLAFVIKGEGDIRLAQKSSFNLLNEKTILAPDLGFYSSFETTISLRNIQNFIRGGA